MTPEEKLLALIQQDKRQAVSATPQEKLLEIIEQDKRNPESAVPSQSVGLASPAPVAPQTPAPVQPVAAAIPVSVKPAPVSVPAPALSKPLPVIPEPVPVKSPSVAVEAPALVKSAPVVVSPPVELKKTPLVVLPPSSAQSTAATADKPATVPNPVVAAVKPASPPGPVASPVTPAPAVKAVEVPAVAAAVLPATQQLNNTATPPASVPKPLIFPTIRVSGVTVTNRLLAVMVVLLIVAVFYSVAGTQRGINDDIERQMTGAGEMAVAPLAISDEPVPTVDVLLEKVSSRNFFSPKLTEKGKSGSEAPEASGAVKDLKLVAVSLDATTASESMAIIKNKVDSKTYFVKMGENVGDTGFVLAKVLADRIVLKQRKQEFELK